jgi:hypothetical protein
MFERHGTKGGALFANWLVKKMPDTRCGRVLALKNCRRGDDNKKAPKKGARETTCLNESQK